MGARIISINRRQWVVGLNWKSYEDRPSKVELKEDAEQREADWIAVRLGEHAVQGGFCSSLDGIKRPNKLASLAAMLADSEEQPWIGTFKIDDGLWWYIAVRDGHAIMPDGDVIGGEAEIRAAQERYAGFGDWNYIDGELEQLADRIKTIKAKPTYIKSLVYSGPSKIQLIAAGTTVAIAAAAGGYGWHLHQEQKKREEAEATARVLAQLNQGKRVAAPESPLVTSYLPSAWLNACREAVYRLPLSQFGWRLDKVSCETQAATAFWKREEGATVADRPDGSVSEDGEQIIQTIPLAPIEQAGIDEAIELQEAGLQVRAWAQKHHVNLALKNATKPKLPGEAEPTGPDGQPLPAPRPQMAISIDSKISPFRLNFDGLPGVRLNSITSNNAEWHIEGIVYGR